MGKIITLQNYVPKSGSTAASILLSVFFAWKKKKSVLLVSLDGPSLESYLPEVKARYTLSHLKALNDDIDNVKMFTTPLNDYLDIIGAMPKLDDTPFDYIPFLTIAKQTYDLVILDLSNREMSSIKPLIDHEIFIMNYDQLLPSIEDTQLAIINGIPPGALSEVKKRIPDQIPYTPYYLPYDESLWASINFKDKFYDYILYLCKNRNLFTTTLDLLFEKISDGLFENVSNGFWGKFVHKKK